MLTEGQFARKLAKVKLAHCGKLSHLVEYDGRQHFEPVLDFGGLSNYVQLITNDERKRKYCASKNLQLIRIPYKTFFELDTVLGKKPALKRRRALGLRAAKKMLNAIQTKKLK